MTRMVLSFSRPDPSSPSAVAGASFSSARRGFDQAEVRDFLRMVSAEMARLHERVVFLERELRESRHTQPMVTSEMNEAMIAELLGEETARVIEAAREAAHKIKERSEEAAGRIIKEATQEAARIREETELECSRRRHDASSDAEAEVLMAKQQGREMVNEARAYRERVLADVARRREMAREQLQDLDHGREKLVHVFERARSATDDVLRDLLQPTDEPMEFVNLAPTTGPVPVIVQADDVGRLEAVRAPSSAPDFAPVEDDIADEPSVSVSKEADRESDASFAEITEIEGRAASRMDDQVPDRSDSDVIDDVGVADGDSESVSNVVPLFARVEERSATVVLEVPGGSSVRSDAEDIFARLRRATTESVAADASRQVLRRSGAREDVDTEERSVEIHAAPSLESAATPKTPDTRPDGGDECFDTRNDVLVPVIAAMSRMAKRVLADEQNQVLDILRGKPVVRSIDALVGSRSEHGGRYVASLNNLLGEAALAGARSLSDEREDSLVEHIDPRKREIQEFVVSTLIDPLRARLERCLAQSSESNAELASLARLVYREWKNQFIDEHMDDVALTAYGQGAAAVLTPAMRVCWKVDPHGPPCADAEDNSLGGFVRGGEEFPTGHTHAPAHAGCRCVLVGEAN